MTTDGNHGFGEGFTLFPVREVVVEIGQRHGRPRRRANGKRYEFPGCATFGGNPASRARLFVRPRQLHAVAGRSSRRAGRPSAGGGHGLVSAVNGHSLRPVLQRGKVSVMGHQRDAGCLQRRGDLNSIGQAQFEQAAQASGAVRN